MFSRTPKIPLSNISIRKMTQPRPQKLYEPYQTPLKLSDNSNMPMFISPLSLWVRDSKIGDFRNNTNVSLS